jgi:hypothetical protein
MAKRRWRITRDEIDRLPDEVFREIVIAGIKAIGLPPLKACLHCKKGISLDRRKDAKFCSNECRIEHNSRKRSRK